MKRLAHPVPPVYLLLAIAAMWALDRFWPIATVLPEANGKFWIVPVVLGLSVIVWSFGLFVRKGTPAHPFQTATAVVTRGPYRFTRNPMYLGMTLILLGGAVKAGSLSAFFPIPAFVLTIHYAFVRHEEAFMENLLGEEYLAYKRSVRRWI